LGNTDLGYFGETINDRRAAAKMELRNRRINEVQLNVFAHFSTLLLGAADLRNAMRSADENMVSDKKAPVKISDKHNKKRLKTSNPTNENILYKAIKYFNNTCH